MKKIGFASRDWTIRFRDVALCQKLGSYGVFKIFNLQEDV